MKISYRRLSGKPYTTYIASRTRIRSSAIPIELSDTGPPHFILIAPILLPHADQGGPTLPLQKEVPCQREQAIAPVLRRIFWRGYSTY